MADTRLSPLHRFKEAFADASQDAGLIRLAEVPFLTQITLRARRESESAREALGMELPAPGRCAYDRGIGVLGLGPDEWLILASSGVPLELQERLSRPLAGEHSTVVDVSAHRTVVELAGVVAYETLLKGCSLDLHPRAFAAGDCAQTALARTGVILLKRTEEPAYWLFVRASFAEYLAQWLLDATAEYRATPSVDVRSGGNLTAVGVPM